MYFRLLIFKHPLRLAYTDITQTHRRTSEPNRNLIGFAGKVIKKIFF